jgi:hypothetical protein
MYLDASGWCNSSPTADAANCPTGMVWETRSSPAHCIAPIPRPPIAPIVCPAGMVLNTSITPGYCEAPVPLPPIAPIVCPTGMYIDTTTSPAHCVASGAAGTDPASTHCPATMYMDATTGVCVASTAGTATHCPSPAYMDTAGVCVYPRPDSYDNSNSYDDGSSYYSYDNSNSYDDGSSYYSYSPSFESSYNQFDSEPYSYSKTVGDWIYTTVFKTNQKNKTKYMDMGKNTVDGSYYKTNTNTKKGKGTKSVTKSWYAEGDNGPMPATATAAGRASY